MLHGQVVSERTQHPQWAAAALAAMTEGVMPTHPRLVQCPPNTVSRGLCAHTGTLIPSLCSLEVEPPVVTQQSTRQGTEGVEGSHIKNSACELQLGYGDRFGRNVTVLLSGTQS